MTIKKFEQKHIKSNKNHDSVGKLTKILLKRLRNHSLLSWKVDGGPH